MVAGGQRYWSRCTECETCEWNSVLARRNYLCKKCGAEVEPYSPPRRRGQRVHFGGPEEEFGGGSDAEGFYDATSGSESERPPQPRPPGILKKGGPGGGKGGKGTSVKSLLAQAHAAATDDTLKADLKAQLDKLAKEEANRDGEKLTPAEAHRRADGAWRNAEHLHSRAVSSVIRLRSNLAAAEEKERSAAVHLAEMAEAKKVAATALAKAEGVEGSPTNGAEKKIITLEWDEEFFKNLEALDTTGEEKQALEELRTQLEGAKQHLTGKGADIQAWLEKMQEHKKTIEERARKKRRADDGEGTATAATPGAASTGAGGAEGAPPTATATATEGAAPTAGAAAPKAKPSPTVQAEADRLSAAKFKAQQEATKAKGKGVTQPVSAVA